MLSCAAVQAAIACVLPMKPVGKCWVTTRASSQWHGTDSPTTWVFHSVVKSRSGCPPAWAVETDADHSVIPVSADAMPGAISSNPAASARGADGEEQPSAAEPGRCGPSLNHGGASYAGGASCEASADGASDVSSWWRLRRLLPAPRSAPLGSCGTFLPELPPGPMALVGRCAGRQRRRRLEPAVGPGVVELDDVAVLVLLDQRVVCREEDIGAVMADRLEPDVLRARRRSGPARWRRSPWCRSRSMISCGRPSTNS